MLEITVLPVVGLPVFCSIKGILIFVCVGEAAASKPCRWSWR
jgi:hypothetical protein